MSDSPFPYILFRRCALPLETLASLRVPQFPVAEQAFDTAIDGQLTFLKQFADHPVLKDGLLFSSHSLADRLPGFIATPVTAYRKKEWQTARTLAGYLTRMAAKTSPFAGFTKVGITTTDGQSLTLVSDRIHHYNHQLFSWLKEVLLSYPPFYSLLQVRLASPMLRTANNYIFLLNSRNIESVQYIEKQDVLTMMEEDFRSGSKDYALVMDRVMDLTGESEDVISGFLGQLLDSGWLVFDWKIPPASDDFLSRLIHQIKHMPDFNGKMSLYTLLEFLIGALDQFRTADDPEVKKTIQQAIKARMTGLTEILHHATKTNTGTSTFFGRFKPEPYPFAVEQGIYQDDYISGTTQVPPSELSTLRQQLGSVLHYLQASVASADPMLMTAFRERSPSGEPIPLLLFYEQYYTFKNDRSEVLVNTADLLTEQLRYIVAGDSAAVVLSLTKMEQQMPLRHNPTTAGALLLPYLDNGHYCAVVNATFPDDGRLWGRYIEAFPPEVTSAIRAKHHHSNPPVLLAEMADDSCMNANLHPPLLPWQIAVAAGASTFPPEKQLLIKDIEVRCPEGADTPTLWHATLNERILPFDMGLEAPANRSPMYRMLLSFSLPFVSHRLLNRVVNQLKGRTDAAGIRHLPRISAAERLILQRRTWFVPVSVLPDPTASLSRYRYWCQMQEWRMAHGLPERVFYSLLPVDQSDQKNPRDRFKPQYLDFTAPILIDIFRRKVKTVRMFKIEEMLPLPDQTDGYAEEILL